MPRAKQTIEPPPRSAGITTRPPRALVVDPRCAEPENADPARLRRLLDAGGYTPLPASPVVVYRLTTGAHQQTGVIVEVSVEDYRNRRIKPHEATEPRRERQLHRRLRTAGLEQMPVVLAHPARHGLRSRLAEITSEGPEIHVSGADGTGHTLWIADDAALSREVRREIAGIPAAYIADGHHRMLAAQRRAGRSVRSPAIGDPGAFTLAALFPSDEMRLFGYHRSLTLPDAATPAGVLELLAEHPRTARIEECASAEPEPGAVVVRLDGRRYRLRLRPREDDGIRAKLDVVALDEEILPVLGRAVADQGESAAGSADGGTVRFLLHPPTFEQVMGVSDAGLLLPPKSTWFAPKARSGLLVRQLR